ncbi:MAG: YfhO family protein, partial [Beijerinckiaceae bacterium]|nr:YfhO family protein [Beijerinckiaceae bacterium]
VAYLSGYLAADYMRLGAPRPNRALAAVALATVIALGAGAVAFAAISHKSAETLVQLAGASVALALAGAALHAARSLRARTMLMSALVVVTCGELVWRNAANVLNARPAKEYALLESPSGEDARIVEAIEADMAKTSGGSFRPRIEVLGLDGPWQNASMILGFEAINGYNPLRIGEYDDLVEPGESPYDVDRRAFPITFPSYNCKMSRGLNLRYLVLDKPLGKLPRKQDVSKFTPLLEGPRAWVYRNEEETPRVSIRTQVRVASIEDYETALDLVTENGQVLVDSDEALSQVYAPKPSTKARARISDWRVDRIEIEIETGAPAILKLNAPYYPGWEVEVDGVRKPVVPVDLLFRGVEIPPGARKVVFAFRPLSWRNLSNALADVLYLAHDP